MDIPIRTIVLVDDDWLVIDEMKTLIDWKSIGFQIVGVAHNGKRAMELISKFHPDLVITDIVMPIMDGLELISAIRKFSDKPNILILTAFDEFEYAKKALQNGVADYILKTEVATKPFYEKLTALHRMIDLQQQNFQRSLYMELYNYFLTNTMGSQSIGDLTEASHSTQQLVKIFDKRYYFYIISQKQKLYRSFIPPETLSVDMAVQKLTDYEQLNLPFACVEFMIHMDFYEILGVQISSPPETQPQLIRRIGGMLLSHADTSLISHVLFYYPQRLSLSEFRQIFYENRKLLDFYSFFPECPTLNIKELLSQKVVPTRNVMPYPPLSREEEAVAAIRFSFSDYIAKLFANHDLSGIDIFFKGFCYHYETLLMDCTPFEEYVGVSGCSELTEWFLKSYRRYAEIYLCSKLSGYSQIVHQAVSLMLNHHGNPDLNISMISKNLDMSPGHLASLFKKETGKTINTYLTDIRIDAALVLLKNTNYKIYEISEKVGYRSSQYFSQIFFGKTQFKPLDVRKTLL